MKIQEFTVKDYRRHDIKGVSVLLAKYAVIRAIDTGDGPRTESYRKANALEVLKFELDAIFYKIKRALK